MSASITTVVPATLAPGSILNHPIITGLVVAISTVIGGFLLYKFIPWIYDIIKESHNLRFYHSIVLPLEQNKIGVINALKFLSGKNISENSGLMSRIGVEGVHYNIPINKHIHFKDPAAGVDYKYRAKIDVDQRGNVGNVVFSTYKRKASGFVDTDRIKAFNAFITSLSPSNITVVVHGTAATAPTAPTTGAPVTHTTIKPTIPSGTTAQMQNMAAATTAGVATDFN